MKVRGLFRDPRGRASKALVPYFGVFQAGHLVLDARYQLVPFAERPPLPFASPPEGWAPQLVRFTSGMAVADLINAAFSLVFVGGFFQRASWFPWLGTVTLTVATYAAFAFTWGATVAGAPALGAAYAWVNVATIPVMLLFLIWSWWVVTGRMRRRCAVLGGMNRPPLEARPIGRMTSSRTPIFLLFVLASISARAQTIRVEGAAERSVPADAIDLVLVFPTELDSFSSSRAAVDGLLERIKATATPACAGGEARLQVEVSSHQPLSWSARPKRLCHRILLRCASAPEQLRAVLASLLDSLLALDPGVTAERISATVSDQRDREVRRDLLGEAVGSALGQAQAAAAAAGSRVVRLASVRALPRPARFAERRRGLPFRPGQLRAPGPQVLIESSSGFSGETVFSTAVHYSAHVVAEFELSR